MQETNQGRPFKVGDTVYWKGRVGIVQKKVMADPCPLIVMFPRGSFKEHADTLHFTEDGRLPSYIREPELEHIEALK